MYRGWFGGYPGNSPRMSIEGHWLSGSFNIGIEFDKGGDYDINITFCLVLFSLYLGFSSILLKKLVNLFIKDYTSRTISLRVFGGALWWDCWAPTDSWSSNEPWWMRWVWHPLDTLFGKMKHSEEELSKTETVIPMPEGIYPCVVTMKLETWKRPRLSWPSTKIRRAHVECEKGVPFPGKGENSWDCGDDALHGSCFPANTVEEGIGGFVASALRNRRRYGGSVNWKQKNET